MVFTERQATEKDFSIVFETKKEAPYKYADRIWSWNKDDQLNRFQQSFCTVNIMSSR